MRRSILFLTILWLCFNATFSAGERDEFRYDSEQKRPAFPLRSKSILRKAS